MCKIKKFIDNLDFQNSKNFTKLGHQIKEYELVYIQFMNKHFKTFMREYLWYLYNVEESLSLQLVGALNDDWGKWDNTKSDAHFINTFIKVVKGETDFFPESKKELNFFTS